MQANKITNQPHADDLKASSEASLARLAAVHASIVAEQAKTTVQGVIEDHRQKLAAWLASAKPDQDLECEGDRYEAFTDAEYAFVTYQCRSGEEVQKKLSYVAECREMAHSLQADYNDEGRHYQALFLRSLTLPEKAPPAIIPTFELDLDTVSAWMWDLMQLIDLLDDSIGELTFNGMSEGEVKYLKNAMALGPAVKCYAEKIDSALDQINASCRVVPQ